MEELTRERHRTRNRRGLRIVTPTHRLRAGAEEVRCFGNRNANGEPKRWIPARSGGKEIHRCGPLVLSVLCTQFVQGFFWRDSSAKPFERFGCIASDCVRCLPPGICFAVEAVAGVCGREKRFEQFVWGWRVREAQSRDRRSRTRTGAFITNPEPAIDIPWHIRIYLTA